LIRFCRLENMKTAAVSWMSTPIRRALSVAALLALAGCGTNESSSFSQGPMLGAMTPSSSDDTAMPVDGSTDVASAPPPSQMVTAGVANLDVSAFVDPAAFRAMDDGSKAQAASAQYYALQFGRVGAARTWNGDASVSGQVNVGPYVKVNNRDCRDFTNVVSLGSRSYSRRGTACREDDGRWTVGSAAAAAPAANPPAAASGPGASG